jgi:hypothetical protein
MAGEFTRQTGTKISLWLRRSAFLGSGFAEIVPRNWIREIGSAPPFFFFRDMVKMQGRTGERGSLKPFCMYEFTLLDRRGHFSFLADYRL